MIVAVFVGLTWFPAHPTPATIAEQRARLPPPAECGDDPVSGVWRAHKWESRFGEWIIFTLTIRRNPENPNQLTGTISNHSWSGTARDEEPPPCRPGQAEQVISMDASGSIDDTGHIRFGGLAPWRLDRTICPNHRWGGYNLDNFDGIIDRQLNEFQTQNNDGGRDINTPYVFRRIRCFSDASPSPDIQTRPPEFYPEATQGCGCL